MFCLACDVIVQHQLQSESARDYQRQNHSTEQRNIKQTRRIVRQVNATVIQKFAAHSKIGMKFISTVFRERSPTEASRYKSVVDPTAESLHNTGL